MRSQATDCAQHRQRSGWERGRRLLESGSRLCGSQRALESRIIEVRRAGMGAVEAEHEKFPKRPLERHARPRKGGKQPRLDLALNHTAKQQRLFADELLHVGHICGHFRATHGGMLARLLQQVTARTLDH